MGLESDCINIERSEYNTPYAMKNSHMHDYYEIYYLMTGTRRYFINHTLYNLEAGDVVLVNKGDLHLTTTVSNEKYHERYLMTFNDEFVDIVCSHNMDKKTFLECFNVKKIRIPVSKRYAFEALLHKLNAEHNRDDAYSKYLSYSHMSELIIFLDRCINHKIVPFEDISVHEERIQHVCKYITNYYNQQITLADISKMAYMSPTYFSKKFKKVTGFGFNEYLNNVRIKMAASMLAETQYSVTEIARFCGYKDSNYFGDVFKKLMGVSPSKYRKNNYTF
ncbi:MAG TPA: AraC family transcriptional regulator [Firmicutes bacterium]|nr:AraC family transcriptional regulator [Bacillota bacterium]